MKKFRLTAAQPRSERETVGQPPTISPAAAALAAFIAFASVFAVAYLSILAARGPNPVASVWPVNALVLVVILRSPLHRVRRWDVRLSAFAGSVLANWVGGSTLAASFAFSIANGVEILIAFLLVRRVALGQAGKPADVSILDQFAHLIRAGLLAPLAGASIAAAYLWAEGHAGILDAWLDWYFAAALGLTIVAPLGVRLNPYDWRRLYTLKGAQSAFACALLVAVASGLVFWQDQWPLLFLITPAILRAANKHRSLGAAASIVLVALIAIPLTAMGRGPLALVHAATPYEKQFFLEFFLLLHALIALRIAAVMDEQDSLRQALEAGETLARQKAAARANLLNFTAHEIRTPLNVISGLGEVLLEGNRLPESDSKLLASMIGAAAQLQHLANDLLDRSRLEDGAIRLRSERVALDGLLSETLLEIKASPHLGSASVLIEAAPNLAVWADPFRTKQIFRNLIVNAIKYAGSYAAIRVIARADGADFCIVDVIDHGPGIAPIRHKDVFEAFSVIGPDRASSAGAGLGLSMVKLLTELQDGSVGFSSAPHIETRFWVKLPTSKPARPHALALDDPDFDPKMVFPH